MSVAGIVGAGPATEVADRAEAIPEKYVVVAKWIVREDEVFAICEQGHPHPWARVIDAPESAGILMQRLHRYRWEMLLVPLTIILLATIAVAGIAAIMLAPARSSAFAVAYCAIAIILVKIFSENARSECKLREREHARRREIVWRDFVKDPTIKAQDLELLPSSSLIPLPLSKRNTTVFLKVASSS